MINESNQMIFSLSQQGFSHLIAAALGALSVAFFMILSVNFILNIFFVLSMHKTMRMIPSPYHAFPPGLLWLIIVPGVGYIFEWIMLPFGIPSVIRSFFAAEGQKGSQQAPFFGLGLAAVIVQLLFLTPFAAIAVWVLKIIYWVKIVNIRLALLQGKTNDQVLT